MKYIDRKGSIFQVTSKQDELLSAIYGSKIGRLLIKPFVHPIISKIGGSILNHPISSLAITYFVRKNKINLKEYVPCRYSSFNDFFTREIKKSARPINTKRNILISPSDGKVSVYKITESSCFQIKNTWYSMRVLLNNEELARKYTDGYAVLIRLTVDDYHRYCYIDDGTKTNNYFIRGKLHTVNPIANDIYPIYKENCREYCILQTENFDDVLQMEVGALMVGKINNYHGVSHIKKGMEKGRFEFGGSTIILFFKKDTVDISKDLLENTRKGYETIVKMGEEIGVSSTKPLTSL